jgi:hypothetical protein
MYITKNEETSDYLHRFTIIELNGKPWEVQAIDGMSTDGIIIIALKEYYTDSIAKQIAEEKEDNIKEEENSDEEIISGSSEVYPYQEIEYTLLDTAAAYGVWSIDNEKKAKILEQSSEKVKISIITGKSGEFNLIYSTNIDTFVKNIKIRSI